MRPKLLDDSFAFSIQSKDVGWSWRVYDLDGVVVAEGLTSTKVDAHAAVEEVYRREHRPEPRRALG